MTRYLPMILLLIFVSCKKEIPQKDAVVKKLYSQFKDGEILEAGYKGQRVYVANLNAYDAGTSIYDQRGNVIGGCNYAYGSLDPICYELTEVIEVYRCKNYINGKTAIDIYHLASEN